MKCNLYVLATLLFGLNLQASKPVQFMANSLLSLKSNEDRMLLEIHYPGPISNICGFRIVSDFPTWNEQHEKLADAIEVKEGNHNAGKLIQGTIRNTYNSSMTYELTKLMLFVGHVEISTKSGKSLASVVDEIMPSEDNQKSLVALTALPCATKN